MPTSFEKYSDILLDAFISNPKQNEIAQKKVEILEELFDYHGHDPESILFIGFSPSIFAVKAKRIAITEVSSDVVDHLNQQQIKFEYIQRDQITEKFSVVIAVDEYLTFAEDDQEQRDLVDFLSSLTSEFIITTLRDYKNQDFRDREFSNPIVIKNNYSKKIYLEHYDYDQQDRNSCLGTSYCISDNDVTVIGPFARRSMYFKQLAKFSLDAGAKNFLVHKNLMHKSIIKKNYEHIITIRF